MKSRGRRFTPAAGLEALALLAVAAGLTAAAMMLGYVLRIDVSPWLAAAFAVVGVLIHRLARPGRGTHRRASRA